MYCCFFFSSLFFIRMSRSLLNASLRIRQNFVNFVLLFSLSPSLFMSFVFFLRTARPPIQYNPHIYTTGIGNLLGHGLWHCGPFRVSCAIPCAKSYAGLGQGKSNWQKQNDLQSDLQNLCIFPHFHPSSMSLSSWVQLFVLLSFSIEPHL